MRAMISRLLLSLALVGACGSDHHAASPDAPPTSDAPPPFMEDMPSSVPQLIDLGGGVLASPKIQPIFFANDATLQAQIEDFATQLATSSYWTAIGSEYGVGAPTILPTIVVTTAAPTTGQALKALVTGNLAGATPAWPYDPDTIYSIFLPDGITYTDTDGSKACDDWGAFHDEWIGAGNQSIVYALMPRCHYPGFSDLDTLTDSASHEWIEASTDPRVETTPAWGDADPEHYVWAYIPAPEVGDYCEYLDTAYQKLVGPYDVQRSWSNAAAKAGHDPCVPAPAQPYVAAAPVLTEDVSIEGFDGNIMTKGVTIPLHMSKTIDVQLYSDQPTDADFTVDAIDVAGDFVGDTRELSFQWDKTTGHNGEILHLTITRTAAPNELPGGSEFAITTSVGSEMRNMWWAFAK